MSGKGFLSLTYALWKIKRGKKAKLFYFLRKK
ncbi:hypothetical protein B14911_28255 [Bacillus sp. NRRL B-14911]|uniref:Uncharacterized protein n=1 Tax=Bacillus infantis NRRL B-14911 TaxID=1367477 RepID=U5LAA5_9BACI|nr:hypothetical protein N288_12085 [Bacillus infantis NRRL B-14911]EAR66976.1 hypothetical protein B14911_28255 [Bacillus sp. NRRL B-14911]